MRRTILVGSLVVALSGVIGLIAGAGGTFAQEGTPNPAGTHPLVGTWVVDTVVETETDSPEIGIISADGTALGLGANRVAGGQWEAIDDQSVMLTLVTVSDSNGMGAYVVVRGVHVLDDTGNGWTCDCTFTVVSADGTVLDSGHAPASATRLPVQGPDAVGNALAEVPTWMPLQPESATPTS
jgi:hypothetical protein